MLREESFVTHQPNRSLGKHELAQAAPCLICRVLWPIVIQHSHLLFDYSGEAKTLLRTRKFARAPRYVR